MKLASSSSTKISVCSTDLPYNWNGKDYSYTGTYKDTLVNAVGCDSIASLELIVKLASSSTTKISVCSSNLPYTWNGKNYSTTGTYKETLVNAVGCDSVASLELTINLASPTTTPISVSVCSSDLPYTWNGNNYYTKGIYKDTLINDVGCDSVITLILNEYPTLNASILGSATVCAYDKSPQIIIKGYSGIAPYTFEYQINDAQTNTISTLLGDSVILEAPTKTLGIFTYKIVRVIDSKGCSEVINKSINVEISDCELDIPNTFTPNSDGINDTFMTGFKVQIYNRNGILLFEGSDGWNGKHKSEYVSKGTYFYTLYYNNNSSQKPKNGYITVIR